MKKNLIVWLTLFFSAAYLGSAASEKIIFPGGTAITTGPIAWDGMAGNVYPIAFNVDAGKLTLILYGVDLTGIRFTKLEPCNCGGPNPGKGAYVDVGVAGTRALIDRPENGIHMFLTSAMGWSTGSGSWNNQSAAYTHDSSPTATDGLGYRKFLAQGWYNPIDAFDPLVPWDNSHNKWNFQFNAEKFDSLDHENQTLDLKCEIEKVGSNLYRTRWWVRLHKAHSWDEGQKTAGWGWPWNPAINTAALGTEDQVFIGGHLPAVPPETTGRDSGAWNIVGSPQSPGAAYFDVPGLDLIKVFPHIGVFNGGKPNNQNHMIRWESLSVEGETYPGKIAVTPDPYDYADLNLGQTKSQVFVIENTTDYANLKVTNMYIAGVSAGDYAIVGPADFVLGPGEKRDVTVIFQPLFQGLRTAQFKIESNDLDNPIKTIDLRGTGVASIPAFLIDEAKIDWKKKPDDDKIMVKGSFVLPSTSNGLNIGDLVTFTIGKFSQSINMEATGKGDHWKFKRDKGETGIKDMKLEFKKNEIKFEIHVDKEDLADMATWGAPHNVLVSLQIGDDKGSTYIDMKEHKDKWEYHK